MFRRLEVLNIKDVAEYQLCCGCGACAYISPEEIRMVDAVDYGRRPYLAHGEPADPRSAEAMKVCPGIELEHTFDRKDPGLIRELLDAWGPIRQVWEGHATDPEIRFVGSSGGVATALALYCLEHEGFYGVLHTRARRDAPYLNETVLSRTREELLAGAGSRYAPASPCDGLRMIEEAPGPCVFIGKPCDVAAVQKARRLRPALDEKVGLTIAFFCAGTPSTRGTLEMLKAMGVTDPATVTGLRYRGHGWPGRARVSWSEGDHERTAEMSYEDSWGMLTKYVQWRCRLCPDHTGEFADVAVGDPWWRMRCGEEAGRSLALARTSAGQRKLSAAVGVGLVGMTVGKPNLLVTSQPNLLRARAAVWGRLLALRLTRTPRPVLVGLPTLRSWLGELGLDERVRSILGTIRRVYRRGVRCRTPSTADEPLTSAVRSGARQSEPGTPTAISRCLRSR